MDREPIVFACKDSKWKARIGDLEIVVDEMEGGAPAVTLHAYDHIKATPCDDEWAEGTCPDGKEVETYEDMDECGKTCPHWREVETLRQSHAMLGGDSVAALAAEARKLLRDQRFARDFIERDWIVGSVILSVRQDP